MFRGCILLSNSCGKNLVEGVIIAVLLTVTSAVFLISLDKMLETTVIFLLFYSHFGGAYNIDTTSPVELKSNENDGLFGHSVALSKNYVYVGAPGPTTNDNKHGNVYKCTISGSCSFVSGKMFKIFDTLIILA